jgi:hypothetical protein
MRREGIRMNSVKDYDVTVESGIISIFQRQNFKLDRVFSEFIDNALQSFLDHQEVLKGLSDGQKCKVSIIWDSEKIVVSDNAYGMNDEEFGRSLKLKAINPNAMRNNQLSVYGMGLKYASVYLGDHYSISSTAYNSNIRFYAEVDVAEFEKNNPKTVEAKLSSDFPELHETVLKITNLRIKKTTDKENDLRQKLGMIYYHYIRAGLLSISVNQIPVIYQMPELRPNEEGGKYYEQFDDSFIAGGKTYHFTGWIGILNKGDQSITGLNLVQAKRCIELGYKPEKLYGKGNSFQNSRVIGEVVFNGENYVLSFNKDKFVWTDDGAEEAFVSKLANNPQISYIIKMSKELSFTDDDDKINKKTKKSFKGNGTISKVETSIASTSEDIKSKTNEPIGANTNVVTRLEEVKYDRYNVKVNGKNTPLYVDTQRDGSKDDWIKFDKYEDGYLIRINFENKFISENFNTQASKAASNAIAIVLATSMLQAQDLGLKLSDSTKLLRMINNIMGNNNG